MSNSGIIGKKHVDYKSILHEDILEDNQETGDSHLIPEINFEAPTPKVPSPCLSPGKGTDCLPPKRDFVLKYRDEEEKVSLKSSERAEFQISDQDWERMEELAERERVETEARVSPAEVAENRRKLQEFRNNPKVDISKTRLAEELKVILAEAQKRLEEDHFPENRLTKNKPKKKRKQIKEVTFQESKQSFDPVSDDSSSNLKDILMKVEMDMMEEVGNSDEDIEEDTLLNGFMEGFEEEEEVDVTSPFGQLNVERGIVFKAGVACLVAFGAAVLLHKIRK